MGVPDFSNGQLVFGPFSGSIFNNSWTVMERFYVDSLGAFQAKFALNPTITGSSVMIHLISSGNALQFFQPAGGGEQFSPSPSLITGHEYVRFTTRPGILSTDRLRTSLFDITASTVFRATGTVTIPNPAAHAGGYIKIGRGDNTSYPFDGRIPVYSIWLGNPLTTDAQENEALAHHRSTDLLNHSVGRPWFLPHLDVSAIGSIVDYGTAALPIVTGSSTGVTFVTDPGTWLHDLDDPIAPPTADVAPSITGSTYEGSTLTCAHGTWSGAPTYAYQWRADGGTIVGATSSTFVTTTAQRGRMITCLVTATNLGGSTGASSNAIGPVRAAIPLPQRCDEFVQVGGVMVRTAEMSRVGGAWTA